MTLTRALMPIACALMLAACDEASTAVDYVDPEPEPATDAPARTDCEEVDFGGAPLAGPGFVDGLYIGPTDHPLIASSTVLYLVDGPEAGQTFEALMTDISGTLMASEGLLGFALGGSQACGAYRTLALWRDMDAMMGFVGSDAHYQALLATPRIADSGTRTVHWTFDPAGPALDWPTGIARTAEAQPVEGLGGE